MKNIGKTIHTWIKNGRDVALAQSMMPAVVALVLAIGTDGFNIFLGIAAVLAVGCVHLGMNLMDDYYDYKVDMRGDRDKVIRQGFRAFSQKYPYLVDGSATEKDLQKAINWFIGIAAVLGVVILSFRSLQADMIMAGIALLCLVLGFSYSAAPLKLGYRGLGEADIAVIFGPMLMVGVYVASAGEYSSSALLMGCAVGCLVMNILYVHSIVDEKGDEASNKMTFARLIGSVKANIILFALFYVLAFGIIIYGVCAAIFSPWYLLVLLVTPRAGWIVWSLVKLAKGEEVDTAKPAFYLGKMENWDGIRQAGIDWFMIRWYSARNVVSGFSLLVILATVLAYFF